MGPMTGDGVKDKEVVEVTDARASTENKDALIDCGCAVCATGWWRITCCLGMRPLHRV